MCAGVSGRRVWWAAPAGLHSAWPVTVHQPRFLSLPAKISDLTLQASDCVRSCSAGNFFTTDPRGTGPSSSSCCRHPYPPFLPPPRPQQMASPPPREQWVRWVSSAFSGNRLRPSSPTVSFQLPSICPFLPAFKYAQVSPLSHMPFWLWCHCPSSPSQPHFLQVWSVFAVSISVSDALLNPLQSRVSTYYPKVTDHVYIVKSDTFHLSACILLDL